MRLADRIRNYLLDSYILPARHQQQSFVTIVAGDVHRAMKLTNQVPSVCQALRSEKFLEENQLTIASQQGPASGLSTTVSITYRLLDPPPEKPAPTSLFHGLRGLGKKTFAELGGGEAFIMSERKAWEELGRRDDGDVSTDK